MERVTIRLKNTGPIGFARAVTPITLQALRQLMVEQLGAALPADGFRFLAGGVPVSLVQEADEDYQEGDVLIAALPPGAAAAESAHAAASTSGSPPSKAGLPSELPPKPPAVSLVSQWVDAFSFMAPEEQMEAIGLLRLRYPSMARLVGEHNSGATAASFASHAQTLPSPGAGAGTPARRAMAMSGGVSGGGRSSARRPTPTSARSARLATPQPAAGPPRPHPQPHRMPAWSPSSVHAGSDLRPAPLDERIARLYYGRSRDGKAMSYGAGERSHRAKSSPPSSRHLRRLRELHDVPTINSVIRSQEAPHPAEGGGGLVIVNDSGNVHAASNNAFAASLRGGGSGGGSGEWSTAGGPGGPAIDREYYGDEATPSAGGSGGGGTPRRLSRSGSAASASEMFGEGASPSSLARSTSALSVGSHESAPKSVAFGSGRPQRPEASVTGHSGCLPTTSRLLGVF